MHPKQPATPPPMLMVKNYSVQIPFNPSELDTETLKTYLIAVKSTASELNQYIQRMEQVLRERK